MFKLLWTLALLTATTSAVNLERNYSDDKFLGMACSTTRGQTASMSSAGQREKNLCRDQQVRTRDILSRASAAPNRRANNNSRREYWVDLDAAARRPVPVFESATLEDNNNDLIIESGDGNNEEGAMVEVEVRPRLVTRDMVLQRVGSRLNPTSEAVEGEDNEPETCPKYEELMKCSSDMRCTIADLMEQKACCDCRMKRIQLNDEIRNLRNESLRIDNELVMLRRGRGRGVGLPAADNGRV